MAIDSDTLDRWASYETAAINSAQDTHQHIRNKLEGSDTDLYEKYDNYETFLQGSYRNYTIIRSDSDVDIVVCLHDFWYSNTDALSASEQQQYNRDMSSSDLTWDDFRDDVLDRLEDVYGTTAIEEGDKAIRIETSTLPLEADVVVTVEYRHYFGYPNNYVEGIAFWPQTGFGKITNYPKQHIENGWNKQDNTNKRFKETVRIFKRARNAADDGGYVDKSIAPSYFIESLLYNASDSAYVNDRQERYLSIIQNLVEADLDEFTTQNELFDLFGNSSKCWDKEEAVAYLSGITELWEDWE